MRATAQLVYEMSIHQLTIRGYTFSYNIHVHITILPCRLNTWKELYTITLVAAVQPRVYKSHKIMKYNYRGQGNWTLTMEAHCKGFFISSSPYYKESIKNEYLKTFGQVWLHDRGFNHLFEINKYTYCYSTVLTVTRLIVDIYSYVWAAAQYI